MKSDDSQKASDTNLPKYISTCCNASVRLSDPAPDFMGDDPKKMEMGARCFICSKCSKPCDVVRLALSDFSDVEKVLKELK